MHLRSMCVCVCVFVCRKFHPYFYIFFCSHTDMSHGLWDFGSFTRERERECVCVCARVCVSVGQPLATAFP